MDRPNGDLHLTGGSLGDLDMIASVFSRVSDDIDGDSRNGSTPYMGADENTQNPLPVELVSFEARVSQGHVVLRWRTATELNNYGFEVHRFNAGDWDVVGFVPGHGTTTAMRQYEFIDTDVTAARQQYRLKQIDTDGTFSFSPTIEVEIMLPKKFELRQNYPNPFNPQTTIAFILPESAPAEIAIFNARAERVRLLLSSFKEEGSHLVFWNGKNDSGRAVASGIYFYTLSAHGETLFTRQMTLVR